MDADQYANNIPDIHTNRYTDRNANKYANMDADIHYNAYGDADKYSHAICAGIHTADNSGRRRHSNI